MTLLDEAMPTYDVRSQHQTMVRATPSLTYQALTATDFGELPMVQLLMGLRTAPARILHGQAGTKIHSIGPAPPVTLKNGLRGGFALLAEQREREIVLGITGRFWSLEPKVVETDPATFRDPIPAGLARAAWNFELEPMPDGITRLTTETRVQCADEASGRRFRRYWLLIGPFSGLIRRAILRQVGQVAERLASGAGVSP